MNIIDSTIKLNNNIRVACPEVMRDLLTTNCAVPDIVHVTYNKGEKKVYKLDSKGQQILDKKTNKPLVDHKYPVLTTILDFADGSRVLVQNSENDPLQLDKDGEPTVFAKECGIVFGLAKRVLAGKLSVSKDGLQFETSGFCTKLNKLRTKGLEQHKLEAEKRREKKAKQKAKAAAPQPAPKAEKPSLRLCVKELRDVITDLKDQITNDMRVVDGKKPISGKIPVVKSAINKSKSKSKKA